MAHFGPYKDDKHTQVIEEVPKDFVSGINLTKCTDVSLKQVHMDWNQTEGGAFCRESDKASVLQIYIQYRPYNLISTVASPLLIKKMRFLAAAE